MKNIIFVVFCLLSSASCFANKLSIRLLQLESNWEQLSSNYDETQQQIAFPNLLDQANDLVNEFPKRAEPIILQACIILTHARIQGPFDALASVYTARDLLLKAVAIDPRASEGSALVTMGVLYYKVPGWPIAFGDEEKADKMLRQALRINPQGIDTNYFYGKFLITQDQPELAARYLKKAVNAPVRSGLSKTNLELQTKARHALQELLVIRVSDATDTSASAQHSAWEHTNYKF